jgi:hypothetical protein
MLHVLEKRVEKSEISPIFQRVGGCLGGFYILYTLNLHQFIRGFGLNHLSLCAEMFSNFLIFGGIFGSIFVLVI